MQNTAALFKVLADPVRFAIIESLAKDGESCACELLDRFTISQPTLSHHMKVLCAAGLVGSRKLGTWMHYTLERQAFADLIGVLTPLAAAPAAEEKGGQPSAGGTTAAASTVSRKTCSSNCGAEAEASV